MKEIRNIRELTLLREKLKYQERLYEKELVGSSANLIDSVTLKMKEAAIDIGTRLLIRLIFTSKNKAKKDKEEKEKNKE